MTPAQKLAAARQASAEREQELSAYRLAQENNMLALMECVKQEVMPKLREARPSEYVAWLRGHLEQGGDVSHVYDYPFARAGFYVALDNIKDLPPGLCGSLSLQIIVPRGLTVEYEDLGHCTLYFMDGFRLVGHWVPIYSDITLN